MLSADSMWAAETQGAEAIGLGRHPIPECLEGDVRIKVEACGICGSDLHFYHNGLLPHGRTPGHEIAGRVDRIGVGVTGLSEGQPVAVEPIRSCGSCEPCLAGRHNICREMQLVGLHQPGGFAQYVTVPAARIHAVESSLAPPVAALTEPVAVALHGLSRGNLEAGQRVLIQGCGAIGLVGIVAARALGAGEVWISARYEHQAELALELGADRVLREEEATRAALLGLSNEVEIDLVLETVGGRAETLPAACAAIRPGGTVSVLGVFMGGVEVDATLLLMREGTLTWSNCYGSYPGPTADFERAAQLVDDERDRLGRLVTHTLPLSDIGEAFRLASHKSAGSIKVSVLNPM